jgi:DNA-binding transcriptional ArsR family regulator
LIVSVDELTSLRAQAHPLRLQLLSLLTAQPMSASEAARELDATQANVSYHLRRLRDAGLLQVAEETRVRGGRMVRYRHRPTAGDRTARRSVEDHTAIAAALTAELQRRTRLRDTDHPGHLTDAELWVDQADWQAFLDAITAASLALHEAARSPRAPGSVRTNATISAFRMRGTP